MYYSLIMFINSQRIVKTTVTLNKMCYKKYTKLNVFDI